MVPRLDPSPLTAWITDLLLESAMVQHSAPGERCAEAPETTVTWWRQREAWAAALAGTLCRIHVLIATDDIDEIGDITHRYLSQSFLMNDALRAGVSSTEATESLRGLARRIRREVRTRTALPTKHR